MTKSKKKIFVLIGHPDPNSFTAALAKSYIKGAEANGHNVKVQSLGDMIFDPILHKGYNVIQGLEPDLLDSQANIRWSDHWVIIHPLWWGSAPALLKGFFDRILLPGFGFKYEAGKMAPNKLLSNRSARVIIVSDTPTFWLKLVYGAGWLKIMKRQVLSFCGFKSIKFSNLSVVRESTENFRKKLIEKAYALGLSDR